MSGSRSEPSAFVKPEVLFWLPVSALRCGWTGKLSDRQRERCDPPRKSSCRLQYHDCGGADGLAGDRRCEVEYQPVDEAADLSMKPLVVAEEYAEHLGQVGAAARSRGEHELLVRQPQQGLLVHVLAKFAQPGASRAAWARLLARVYEVDALRSGLLRQGLGRERRPFPH